MSSIKKEPDMQEWVKTEPTDTPPPWAGVFSSTNLTTAAERRRARARKMRRSATNKISGGGTGSLLDGGGLLGDKTDGALGVQPQFLTKKQLRMMRNRESAALSRKRKRDQIDALEMEVKQLKEKNRSLKLRLSKYEIQDSLSSAPSFQGSGLQTGSFDSPGLDTRLGVQEPVSWTDSIQNFLIANKSTKGAVDKGVDSSGANAQYDLTSFQPANTFLGENQPPQDQIQGMLDSSNCGLPAPQMYYSQCSQPKISPGITSYQPPPTLDTGPIIKPDPATWQQSFSIQPLIDMTSDFYYGDLIPEKQQGFQNRTPSESWYLPYSNSEGGGRQSQNQNQDFGTGSWYNNAL